MIVGILGIVGLVGGAALVVRSESVRWLSLACALVAPAVGEIVLVFTTSSAGDPRSWYGLLAFYPLAVLSVGGWAALLGGGAGLFLRTSQMRPPKRLGVVVWCVTAGAIAGLALPFLMVLERLTGKAQAAGYLFSTEDLLLAGAAGGALCGLWPLADEPSNPPLHPTIGAGTTN